MKTHMRLCVLAIALILLAACSGDDEIGPPCPTIAPVPTATTVTRFTGEGRDLTDVDFSAQISNVNFTCEYDDNTVVMDLQIVFEATRGPANESGRSQFSYFIAIGKRSRPRDLLAREEFAIGVAYQGNRRRQQFFDESIQRFPLAPGEDGGSYVVFVGLVVTRDELEYNRANR